MGWRTGTGCCAPARRPTRSVSSGWWATRCRPPARSRSVDRCCSAARPCCRPSWCTASRDARRKEPVAGPVDFPPGAQDRQQLRREHHVAVLLPLALRDAQHHAFAVDGGHGDMQDAPAAAATAARSRPRTVPARWPRPSSSRGPPRRTRAASTPRPSVNSPPGSTAGRSTMRVWPRIWGLGSNGNESTVEDSI